MAQGRQAKILTPRQETAILHHLQTTRYPDRDQVMFLLSLKAGMRAREIAALTWAMVTDAEGQVGGYHCPGQSGLKGKQRTPDPHASALTRGTRDAP